MRFTYIMVFSLIITMILAPSCDSGADPVVTTGGFKGTVRVTGQGEDAVIQKAYIIHEFSLLATTDAEGNYRITNLESGLYTITCSAVGYKDTVQVVTVTGGANNIYDFYLKPDTTKARLRGEFQDLLIFENEKGAKPEMKEWDAKEVFMGVTGATMYPMGMQRELPDREVYLDDQFLIISDDFGQYWIDIQCGTYPLRGACDGYEDDLHVFKVRSDRDNYLNFFLIQELEE
jgi:hypothetical protein